MGRGNHVPSNNVPDAIQCMLSPKPALNGGDAYKSFELAEKPGFFKNHCHGLNFCNKLKNAMYKQIVNGAFPNDAS